MLFIRLIKGTGLMVVVSSLMIVSVVLYAGPVNGLNDLLQSLKGRSVFVVDRLVNREDGAPIFVESHIPAMSERSPAGEEGGGEPIFSLPIKANEVFFAHVPEGYEAIGPASADLIVIILSGRMEITTPDGESRIWGAGDVFLETDTGGDPHVTRVIEGPVEVVAVRIDETFDLDKWTNKPPAR